MKKKMLILKKGKKVKSVAAEGICCKSVPSADK